MGSVRHIRSRGRKMTINSPAFGTTQNTHDNTFSDAASCSATDDNSAKEIRCALRNPGVLRRATLLIENRNQISPCTASCDPAQNLPDRISRIDTLGERLHAGRNYTTLRRRYAENRLPRGGIPGQMCSGRWMHRVLMFRLGQYHPIDDNSGPA